MRRPASFVAGGPAVAARARHRRRLDAPGRSGRSIRQVSCPPPGAQRMSGTDRRRRGVLAAVLMAAAFSAIAGAQAPAQPAKKNPLLKLIEPWPAPEAMKQRRLDAEALPLFASDEPFTFTLAADFKTLNKDHDPESKKRYPGELRIPGEGGPPLTLPLQLSAPGHVRRMAPTCDYVRLRVEFPKQKVAGTVFARQSALKLVVQCVRGGDFEQFLLREHLAYRLFNVLTPRSFRSRLAKVTYVDQVTGQATGARWAMVVEDDSDG